MPSAPAAKAAAIPTPSTIPPAAIIGKSVCLRIDCSKTYRPTSSGFLNPPPSVPSTTNPSTPALTALRAPARLGTA